ncbi:MAG TPA: GAF domain-containing protein [Candidatus Kapabacteria bacterium]|nr:GAF domain-containing protein [Candidatus Kapabacteria bacterium]
MMIHASSESLSADLAALLSSEDHPITLLANTAAYIYDNVERLNWVGFYLFDGTELILGPFSGKPACTRIAIGSGVCGTAAQKKETIVVPDVDAFPGHIVCDSNSRSEIVMPLLQNGEIIAVFDIDSPELSRFGDKEKAGFEKIRDILMERLGGRRIL